MSLAYLDSSVILTREFGYDSQKEEIDKLIGGAEKLASKYVKMEIWRTFLKDAIYVHSLMLEEQNLKNVLQRISSIRYKPRVKARCIEILSRISDKLALRLEDAIARLELLIEGFEKLLFSDIRLLNSGTRCPLPENIVQKTAIGYTLDTRCTRHMPECGIRDFLLERRSLIIDVQRHIEDLEPETLKKLRAKLGDIINRNFDNAKGRNCMILGDLIICLDSTDNSEIFSTNIDDFEPICSALRKRFRPVRLSR